MIACVLRPMIHRGGPPPEMPWGCSLAIGLIPLVFVVYTIIWLAVQFHRDAKNSKHE